MKTGLFRGFGKLFVTLAASFSLCAITPAQAPEGPQSGPPSQGNPAPQQAPPPATPRPATPAQQRPAESGTTISVEVPVVTLDVVATTSNGDVIPGLKRENFRVFEDGVPQSLTNFAPSEAPITMVLLMEFSARSYGFFAAEARSWAGALFPNLTDKDWIALVTFDMKTRTEVDFTQNKDEVRAAIAHMYYPGFSESNVFDAILETVDNLKGVKGKKSIVVLASGIDTFSKHTLDQTIKQLRQTDTSIFVIGVAKPIQNYMEMHGGLGGRRTLDFLQAENQMKTFASMTGGMAWFPQFDGEIPAIFHEVAAFLRHQYSLTYNPTNHAADGKYRKVKVELVAADGSPLIVNDQRGKKQKIVVYAREGYTAPKGGVGD
jgi:VWFA-related protein